MDGLLKRGVGPILGEARQDIGDFANFALALSDDGKTDVRPFFSRTKLIMVTPAPGR